MESYLEMEKSSFEDAVKSGPQPIEFKNRAPTERS